MHPWAPHWRFLSTKGTTQLSSQVHPAHPTATVVVLQWALFLLKTLQWPPRAHRVKDKTMQGPLSPLLSVDDTGTLQQGVTPTLPAWTPLPPMSAGLAPSLALMWFLQWSVLCPPIKIMLPGSISLPLPIYFPDSLYHYLKYSMFYLLISLSLSPIRL